MEEELISAAQFQDDMRAMARSYRFPAVDDALGKMIAEIESKPAFAESRLLTRIVVSLAQREGAFRRADLTLLSNGALGMVASLFEGHAAGKITHAACEGAATRVLAAQRLAEA